MSGVKVEKHDFVRLELVLAFIRLERAGQWVGSSLSARFGVPIMIEANVGEGVFLLGSDDEESDRLKLFDYTIEEGIVLRREGFQDINIAVDDEDGAETFRQAVVAMVAEMAADVAQYIVGAQDRRLAGQQAEEQAKATGT
jgi:hypothetical protein